MKGIGSSKIYIHSTKVTASKNSFFLFATSLLTVVSVHVPDAPHPFDYCMHAHTQSIYSFHDRLMVMGTNLKIKLKVE
jgi:hypothetical protein